MMPADVPLIVYYLISAWIAAMLTIQSYILWRVHPEIKKVSRNSEQVKDGITSGKFMGGLFGG